MSDHTVHPVDSRANTWETFRDLSERFPELYDGNTELLRCPAAYHEPEVLDEDPVMRASRQGKRDRIPFNLKWFFAHTAQRLFSYPIRPCHVPSLEPTWSCTYPAGVLFANDLTEEGLDLICDGLELWNDGREMEARAKFEAVKALLEHLTPKEAAEQALEAVAALDEALGHFGERDIEKAIQGFWDAWPLVSDLMPDKSAAEEAK